MVTLFLREKEIEKGLLLKLPLVIISGIVQLLSFLMWLI